MKQILVVVPTTRIGGAEQYLRMVSVFYAKAGCRVTVFFLKKEPLNGWSSLEGNPDMELVYMNERNSEIRGWKPLIEELYRRRFIKFDYVYSSHVHINSMLGVFRQFNLLNANYLIGREPTSAFLYYHGINLLLHKWFYFIGYGKIDLIICQTDLMKEQLLGNLLWLREKTVMKVIPNPIDMDFIEEKSKECFDFEPNKDFIVAAGRLVHIKGFDILINAFAELKTRGAEYKLLILGEGPDREKLEQLIERKGLVGDVHLIGYIENVLPYFKKAKVCIVSSRMEGFPNVLLQMMTQNNRVVSTLCSGGISMIPSIYTAETENVGSLVSAVETAMSNPVGNTREVFNALLKEREIGSFIHKIENLL